MGEDGGVLVRELWRLLHKELHSGRGFFHGCREAEVPLHNTAALEVQLKPSCSNRVVSNLVRTLENDADPQYLYQSLQSF